MTSVCIYNSQVILIKLMTSTHHVFHHTRGIRTRHWQCWVVLYIPLTLNNSLLLWGDSDKYYHNSVGSTHMAIIHYFTVGMVCMYLKQLWYEAYLLVCTKFLFWQGYHHGDVFNLLRWGVWLSFRDVQWYTHLRTHCSRWKSTNTRSNCTWLSAEVCWVPLCFNQSHATGEYLCLLCFWHW